MYSVNVLLYGDHADLAARCLTSLLSALTPKHVQTVRVGLNEVSPRVDFLAEVFAKGVARMDMQCLLYKEESNQNVMKYPLMRRMIHDPRYTLDERETRVMWFDDDTYVTDPKPEQWFDRVETAWRAAGTKLMGAPYQPRYNWNANERAAIAAQPWCRNVAVLGFKPTFVTGGWWVADLEFLREWGYPFPELRHNGGDVLLGEVCRQQGVRIVTFRNGVAINADKDGRESFAKRRGVTTPRPFEGPPPYEAEAHHAFEVDVRKYGHWYGDNYVDV